jgi:Chlorophyll A-B binding protein
MKLVVLASLIGASAAFAPASSVSSKATSSMALNAEKMPAMPFLPYPEAVRGYVGDDVAFDPLGLSSYFPMDYLRESEIKHGRICMLAIVGYITVDLGIVVHPLGKGLTSATAHDAMAAQGVMGNILIWMCVAEAFSYLAVSEMLQGSGREPGNYGFGTWYYDKKTPEQIKKLKYQEIKNGRLAMMAFAGAVTQSVLYDKGFPYF